MRDPVENLALRVTAVALRRLSPGAAAAVARFLGRMAWRLGIRRGVTAANVALAFPGRDLGARAAIGRASCESLALTATEFLRLPARILHTTEVPVEFRGWEHLAAARDAGRGVIVASAHLGNWELYGAAAVALGIPVTFVVQHLRNARLDRELCRRRRALGLYVLERGMALRNVASHLERNHLVAMMCDQDARQRGVFVSFFGRPASTHKGAAQLAYRHRVPLVPFLGHRRTDGSHRVEIHPPLEAHAGSSEDEFVQTTMQDFHRLLERTIQEHPEAYLWQHRRWKTTSPHGPTPPEGGHEGAENGSRSADGSHPPRWGPPSRTM